MQIRDESICFYYILRSKPPFLDDHANGVCCGFRSFHVTFGGSGGIMTTAGHQLLYP